MHELGLPNATRDLTGDELLEADEIFMASTAGGIVPIRQLADRILSNGAPGPLTRQLHEAYWRRHEAGWHATPVAYGAE